MNPISSAVDRLQNALPAFGPRRPWGGKPKIVFFGTGVVGGTVGGWVARHHDDVYFLDQGVVAEALKERGLSLYLEGHQAETENIRVKVIDSLAELKHADVVVLAVKNYSLEAVSQVVQEHMGDRPVIVAMQNGLANQDILPRFFSKVIYCVVCYNAWMDEPGVLGYQKHGPLALGTLNNELQPEMEVLADVFNRGVPTVISPHIQDAIFSKLIINLTNSVTTLIGHTFQEISRPDLFQKLLTNVTYEGSQIVKAAGFKECKLGGMPPWKLMWAGAKLPTALTRPMFNRNVKKMVISSMAQDVIQRGAGDSELETINGALLALADRVGHPAPFNRAIYELCRQEFAKDPFTPLDVTAVWDHVQRARG